jgi:hypothetical protein
MTRLDCPELRRRRIVRTLLAARPWVALGVKQVERVAGGNFPDGSRRLNGRAAPDVTMLSGAIV